MIQVFKTDEDYKKWLDGQRLPSGIVVYVSDDETMYFSTNNIKGELKTYECKKEEPIQYPPLIYSTNAAGSTITVNGQSMTLEQGNNITLEYPTAITSVKATNNTALTAIQIPNTVVSINDNAFTGCTALTDFNFNGTKAQWGAITLGTNWKNNAAFTVVHCTDGDVSLEEVIQYPPLVYSAKSAGSTITVNGQSMTLEQGDNIELNYPNEITSVEATNNTVLTYIQIPNTVVSINDNAFTGCTELTDFRYNGTVEEWGAITLGTDWNKDAAFTVVHCTDGDVTLEEPIQPIQPTPLVYSAKSAGSTITVNGQSMTLEQGENIVLDYPNEITSVKATRNTALTAITIPNTVTIIEGGTTSDAAFADCSSLTSVNIQNGTTTIGGYAFYYCSAMTSVTLPESLTNIGGSSFRNCYRLASITIPNSVTIINAYAFYNCSTLRDFNYNGTMSQWRAITLGTDWNLSAPFTVVHCTDGDVTL